jgi:hypothetical protein
MRRRRKFSPRDLLLWLVIVAVACSIIAVQAFRNWRVAESRRQQHEQLQNSPGK